MPQVRRNVSLEIVPALVNSSWRQFRTEVGAWPVICGDTPTQPRSRGPARSGPGGALFTAVAARKERSRASGRSVAAD
jgi:hypothetical protein